MGCAIGSPLDIAVGHGSPDAMLSLLVQMAGEPQVMQVAVPDGLKAGGMFIVNTPKGPMQMVVPQNWQDEAPLRVVVPDYEPGRFITCCCDSTHTTANCNGADNYTLFAQLLVNQEALMRRIMGEPISALPYFRSAHRNTAMMGGATEYDYFCRLKTNQDAILRLLCGEPVKELPCFSVAHRNTALNGMARGDASDLVKWCQLKTNQDAILKLICGEPVTELPCFTAADRNTAMHSAPSDLVRMCQLRLGQEEIFRKAAERAAHTTKDR